MLKPLLALAAGLAVASPALAADRADSVRDTDTRAWWRLAEHLSSDEMEGRDTGSAGHQRAAAFVADQFRAAGWQPAGDNGTFFQTFPLHEARVTGATVAATAASGASVSLPFLKAFTVRAADDLPSAVEAPVLWGGLCRSEDLAAARGKWVVCLSSRRKGETTAAQRLAAAEAAGAAGLVNVDDPFFTIEPARWPAAYARTITFGDQPPPTTRRFPVLTVAYERLGDVMGTTRTDLIGESGAARVAAPFEAGTRLAATFTVTTRNFTGANVLARLPGSDPRLADETLVLSAHLDGYGYGEPVNGDGLYNGTLDDAAYVGTLIRFAERHRGRPLKRSVVLAAFTGEEKGLLGARWFVDHPTVPKESLVANINLDQLRPLFPLELMTVLAIDDSSLGATVKAVAGRRGIQTQADPEPERGLLGRADHWPFMQAGIPATGFIFGYRPGAEAERRYREWYQIRYHRPQDDVTQPMDFQAAGDFNRFFYDLAETVANAPQRPTWTPGSPYAPKP